MYNTSNNSEEAKRNKRVIDRAGRTVDRERTKLQMNEKKLLAEIKSLAKQNKHVGAFLRNFYDTEKKNIECCKDSDERLDSFPSPN